MKRTARDSRERYSNIARPVQKAQLSEKNPRIRMIAVILLAIIGAMLLSYAFVNFLNKEEGWSEITANSSSELSCSEEFVFSYDVSGDVDSKQIRSLYTETCIKAYELFSTDAEFDELYNMAYINAHPNEEITVDEVLYNAFEKLKDKNDRAIYLGPVYDYYDNVFFCTDDNQLADYDGSLNEELAMEYRIISEYAADENAIDIKLLGSNRICLYVSDEYERYLEDVGSNVYIDFYWMKNAFITDYISDVFIKNGYTRGFLSSKDGFTKAFSDSVKKADEYVYKMYHLDENIIYAAGEFTYSDALSIVTYRAYGINDFDTLRFYETKDGRILTKYLSTEVSESKAALSEITFMSHEKSCADVMLSTKTFFIADEFEEAEVNKLKSDEIYSLYFKDKTVFYNDEQIEFSDLYEKNNVKFNVSYVN